MQRKLLVGLGLVLLFIFVFVIAFVLVFPTDSTRHYAEQLVSKQLNNKQAVEIKTLKVSPLLNVTLKDISLTPISQDSSASTTTSKEGDYDGNYCPASVDVEPFVINEIFVNPSLFASLGGSPNGTFKITINKGTIDGSLKTKNAADAKSDSEDKDKSADNEAEDQNADEKKSEKTSARSNRQTKTAAKSKQMINVEAKGKALSLEDLTILSNTTHAKFFGELGFDTNVVLQKTGAKTSLVMVTANLTSEGTSICPINLKLSNGIPISISYTQLGDINADIEVSDNKLTVNSITSTGPDIQLDVTGSISARAGSFTNGSLNIQAKITPSESWLADNDMDIIYQKCRRLDDGSIELKLTGPIKKPQTDCGTPIPIEKPAAAPKTEKKEETKSDKTKEKKSEKKTTEEKKKVEKPEENPEPAPGTPAEIEEDKPKRRINRGSDDPARNRPGGERPVRNFGDKAPTLKEGASLDNMPKRAPGRRAQMDRIEGDISRAEGKRRRGDMELPTNGEPMDRD